MNAERVAARLDLAGAGLAGATGSWFVLTSADNVGDSLPAIAVLAVAVGGVLMARASAELLSPAIPAALVVGAAIIAVLFPGGTSAPLGYANANGTFFALAAFAALFVWSTAHSRAVATGAIVVAVMFGLTTVLMGSLAASALLALAPGVVLAARFGRGRIAVLVCAVAVGIALATTLVLGSIYAGEESAAGSALTERRLALWHDALLIVGRHPLAGAGFDRFEELSPTARSDQDARWAHNEFLQVGAETGIPGLVLVAALFLWGFARLAAEPVSIRDAVAAAGLAAVGIHASIDYVLHFVAIPLSASVLLGAALARGQHRLGDSARYDAHSDSDQRPR